MLVITSDLLIKKHTESLTGQTVIGFLTEPDDSPPDISKQLQFSIFPRIAPATSHEHLLMVADLLRKYLHQEAQ